jgi:hypothetical protein
MTDSALSRRTLLAGVASLGAATPVVAGCSVLHRGDSHPDPLLPLARGAGRDAAAAAEVASAYPGFAAASAVAKARRQQADAIWQEIGRAKISPTETTGPSASPQVPRTDRSAAKEMLTRDLSSAQHAAAEMVATLPSYRAGLVASVSAGCASLKELF